MLEHGEVSVSFSLSLSSAAAAPRWKFLDNEAASKFDLSKSACTLAPVTRVRPF